MNARLVGKTREGQDNMSKFEIEERATIGRSASNTIVIEDPSISGQHVSIAYDAEEKCYFLEDLKSLNGTELDGMRVKERERLGRLHVITLAGSRDLIFQDLDLCAPAEAPSRPAPRPSEPAPVSESKAQLDELSDDAAAAIGRALPRLCRAVMKATGASAYNILQNNGGRAGQVVLHVHFHIIPRFEHDGLSFKWNPSELKEDTAIKLLEAMHSALSEEE